MPDERLPLAAQVEEHLYRIVLEALHNAVKHAQTERIWLRMSVDLNGTMLIEVGDDGIGFSLSQPHPGHLGMTTMAERAAAIGATLNVSSAPGAGTTVRIRFSLTPRSGDVERKDQ